MNIERYEYLVSADYLDYEFYSDGPNGKIKKIIRFAKTNAAYLNIYNLAFGDLYENGDINDIAVSNNYDRDKILATVAFAVTDFTSHFPGSYVFAIGSTASRTRLYRMGITLNWELINELFYLYALTLDGTWVEFERNKEYSAFLIKRK